MRSVGCQQPVPSLGAGHALPARGEPVQPVRSVGCQQPVPSLCAGHALPARGEPVQPPAPRSRGRRGRAMSVNGLVAGRFGGDAGMLLASLPRLPEPTARPVLVVMTGLPGTGKSTVARALAAQFPLIHLETDVLRRVLFPCPTYVAAENRRLFPAIHRLIGALLDRSLPVLFDATNLTEPARRRPYKIATERGAVLAVVSVVAPEGVVRERLARRAGGGRDPEDRSDADWDTYLGMARTWSSSAATIWSSTHRATSRRRCGSWHGGSSGRRGRDRRQGPTDGDILNRAAAARSDSRPTRPSNRPPQSCGPGHKRAIWLTHRAVGPKEDTWKSGSWAGTSRSRTPTP